MSGLRVAVSKNSSSFDIPWPSISKCGNSTALLLVAVGAVVVVGVVVMLWYDWRLCVDV